MLKNLSISLKLYLVVAIALGALAVFGATTYSTVRLVMVNGPVYARIVQGKDLVADILPPPAYILESKLTLLELLNAKDDAQRAPLLERMAKLEKEYAERHEYWSANLGAGAMKETLLSDAHKPALEFYKVFSEQFKPLVVAGKHDEAEALAQGRLEQLYVTHRAAIDKVVDLAGKFSAENEASAAAITGQRSLLLIGVALGSAAVTLVLATLIIRAITRPLGRVIQALRLIAANNLSVPPLAMDGKDEVAQLGRAADAMAASLKGMVGEVVSITHQVAAAATEVAASAEEMAHGMKQQQGQTQQVSAAIEEMSCSVVEVAKKSSDAATAASVSGKQAEHGGDVVARTVTEMKGIATQVTESARAVGSLGHKSEEIGQIIGVINDIADQTNLLALNAAIEAARAGEHGRGFAVVADEVRKLAERTTQATKEVATSIREIQDETKSAVERIDGGAKQVATGVELAGSAGEALQKIVAGSLTVQQMVQSIAAAAEEQSSASTQIARSIEAISAVTLESTEGANQAAMAAAQLSERAESLQKLVSRFKV